MILVVGGTGRLGRLVVESLAARQEVRVLARHAAASMPSMPYSVEPVDGDVRDPATVIGAADGVSCIVVASHGVESRERDGLDTVRRTRQPCCRLSCAAGRLQHRARVDRGRRTGCNTAARPHEVGSRAGDPRVRRAVDDRARRGLRTDLGDDLHAVSRSLGSPGNHWSWGCGSSIRGRQGRRCRSRASSDGRFAPGSHPGGVWARCAQRGASRRDGKGGELLGRGAAPPPAAARPGIARGTSRSSARTSRGGCRSGSP